MPSLIVSSETGFLLLGYQSSSEKSEGVFQAPLFQLKSNLLFVRHMKACHTYTCCYSPSVVQAPLAHQQKLLNKHTKPITASIIGNTL